MDKASWVIDAIKNRAGAVPSIKKIHRVASISNDIVDPGTELRLQFVVDAGVELEDLVSFFKLVFGGNLRMILLVPSSTTWMKAVLHLDGVPRIDVQIANGTEFNLEKTGTLIIVYERPAAAENKGKVSTPVVKKDATTSFIKARVSKILHDFELVSIAHFHSDYLGYYAIYYPMVLDTIHLQGILSGKTVATSSTKNLLNSVMTELEQQYFTKNLLDAGFGSANQARQHFMEWFFFIAEELQDKYGIDALPATIPEIQQFCEAIHETYYLRNFRPVQGTKHVFRSLAPGAYRGDPRLERWFLDHDIETLVDLRRPDEVAAGPDDADLAKKLGQTIHLLNFNADDVAANDYVKGLIGCNEIVRKIFHAILESPGNTLIHCGAGKDRTGIVSALIELFVGVPEDVIIAAYLLSGQDTREERILQSLAYVREHGGIKKYLASCGFGNNEQEKLKRKLMM